MTAEFLNPQTARSRRRRTRPTVVLHPQHQWVVWETIFKLSLNTILSLGAIATLIRLVPFHQEQQAKLHQIEMQVQETETRVREQRREFNRSFDPSQSRRLMQELTPRLDPHQRKIILTEPASTP